MNHKATVNMRDLSLILKTKNNEEIRVPIRTSKFSEIEDEVEVMAILKNELPVNTTEEGKDRQIEQLLLEFKDILAEGIEELTSTNIVEHEIDTLDHPDIKTLVRIFDSKEATGRLARWSLILKEYDFEITHKKGTYNQADYISRATTYDSDKKEEFENSKALFVMDFARYRAIVSYLSDKVYPTDTNEQDRNKLRNQATKYNMEDGVLKKKDANYGIRDILHENNVEEKIREIHDEEHWGIINTWNRVKLKYTGKGIFEYVKKVVNYCPICQRHSGSTRRRNRLHPIIANAPFKYWE
ncbi:hypothetical protein AX774_g8239 [Zancudomyces culisetae]|uniref:Integrase zinc-binding domain-containing protein n=1 Tax=Zancudomyces culisetae TaxID=1213189 RepID=A0A1R1PBM1_ZANCU|nr:hypothetical protein AX774_g8239 [Zancudomyces culisetae]|eukprot:OMH78375.1 hypothetical protein AX774_g8239 [Zancudomyces culisetae]